MAVPDDRGPGSEKRQDLRFRFMGVVFLHWIEADDENYVMGKCVDISMGGLGVEVALRIPVGTEVKVRAEWVNLDGSATVRRASRRGAVFQIGLQLKHPLDPDVLAKALLME